MSECVPLCGAGDKAAWWQHSHDAFSPCPLRPALGAQEAVPLADVSEGLVADLQRLFDEYGPLGVEQTVVQMRRALGEQDTPEPIGLPWAVENLLVAARIVGLDPRQVLADALVAAGEGDTPEEIALVPLPDGNYTTRLVPAAPPVEAGRAWVYRRDDLGWHGPVERLPSTPGPFDGGTDQSPAAPPVEAERPRTMDTGLVEVRQVRCPRCGSDNPAECWKVALYGGAHPHGSKPGCCADDFHDATDQEGKG